VTIIIIVIDVVIRCADLHMAQLMPLPLTVSCFSKIQIGFICDLPVHPGSPGNRSVKRVCVCVCVIDRHVINYETPHRIATTQAGSASNDDDDD